MKVAITGHTAGIGQAFATWFADQGHEVVGLSRRTGRNIRSIPKCVGDIVDCDMFINNAQAGFAQTELLYKVWHQWHSEPKLIWLIGSIMSTQYATDFEMQEYQLQKQTIDRAYYNLKNTPSKCNLMLIRPGKVDTQNQGGANVTIWANTVCECWKIAQERNLSLQEISLGS